MKKPTIDKELIIINPEEVLSLLGNEEAGSDPFTIDMIEVLIEKCSGVMSPQGGYITHIAMPVSSKDEVAIDGCVFNTGGTINKMLQGSETYAFFIATAGHGPEELSRSLIKEGSYLEGYIADLVGSAIVESTATQVHNHIKEDAEKKGLSITNRYSPGYCGWEVVEQQKLFKLFPDAWCGITLSESSLMSPIKSVSGVVGTGTSVSFRDYTCELCSMKDCIFRQTRESKALHSPE